MTYFDRDSELREGARSYLYFELKKSDMLTLKKPFEVTRYNDKTFAITAVSLRGEVALLQNAEEQIPLERLEATELMRFVDAVIATGEFTRS